MILAGRNAGLTRSGFTLIELVISGGLMAVILTSAYLCLSAAVSSQKLIDSRSDAAQTARVALALMAADLRCAVPLSRQFEFLGMARTLADSRADNLDFATANYTPRRQGEGDYCEVSYYLEKDAKMGLLRLWRRRDPTPDPEPLAGGSRELLASGARTLQFEYYDGWDWFDDWGDPDGKRQQSEFGLIPPNLSGMPEAVRITLSIEPDAGRNAQKAAGEKEPPLVFQTIVRLNMAATAERTTAFGEGQAAAAPPAAAMEGSPQ